MGLIKERVEKDKKKENKKKKRTKVEMKRF